MTSRTGLWISAGQKSAVREFLLLYFTLFKVSVCSLLFYSHQGQYIINEFIQSTAKYIGLFVFMCAFDPLCDRKQSKAGVSLLKPEPRLRGAADSVLNSVRTLPCHIIG